jgi:hypothetical protein
LHEIFHRFSLDTIMKSYDCNYKERRKTSSNVLASLAENREETVTLLSQYWLGNSALRTRSEAFRPSDF